MHISSRERGYFASGYYLEKGPMLPLFLPPDPVPVPVPAPDPVPVPVPDPVPDPVPVPVPVLDPVFPSYILLRSCYRIVGPLDLL